MPESFQPHNEPEQLQPVAGPDEQESTELELRARRDYEAAMRLPPLSLEIEFGYVEGRPTEQELRDRRDYEAAMRLPPLSLEIEFGYAEEGRQLTKQELIDLEWRPTQQDNEHDRRTPGE
jgi:hypothetical protein